MFQKHLTMLRLMKKIIYVKVYFVTTMSQGLYHKSTCQLVVAILVVCYYMRYRANKFATTSSITNILRLIWFSDFDI